MRVGTWYLCTCGVEEDDALINASPIDVLATHCPFSLLACVVGHSTLHAPHSIGESAREREMG